MSLLTNDPLTASPTNPEKRPTSADMVISLGIVGWDGFQAAADLLAERRYPRLLYHDGSLTLMTPSALHERCVDRLDALVKAICVELDIAFMPTGSTLYRRQDLDHGIMADKSYYIDHEAPVRAAGEDIDQEIDLNRFPPPDLVIEAEVTHPATGSVAICRALGVPEVWVSHALKHTLTFLHLNEPGQYVEARASLAFPFLTTADALPWVERRSDEPENRFVCRLHDWVRDVLGPRRAGGA